MGLDKHSANESFEEMAAAAEQQEAVETNDAEVKATEASNETAKTE